MRDRTSEDEPERSRGDEPTRAPYSWEPPADAPPVHWGPPPPPAAATTGRFSIGTVIGRTLDTYGSEWSLYLLVALVPATVAGLGIALPEASGWLLLAGVFASLAAYATMALATDDLWLGRRPELGSLVSRTLRLAPRLLLAAIVLAIVLFGAALAAGFGIWLIAVALGEAGAAIGLLAMLALAIGAVILGVRWSLFLVPLILEGRGPLASLNRSFDLTRGHAWRMFGLLLLLGLLAGIATAGSSMVSTYSPNRLLATLALVLGSTVGTPVLVIASVLVFGDLTERGYRDSDVVRAGRGRGTAAGIVIGIGLVLGVVGTAVSQEAGGLPYDPDRGTVIAGRSQNIFDACHPSDRTTRFTVGDRVWMAGVFSESVPAGEPVTVRDYLDGKLLGSAAVKAGPIGSDCYAHEPFTVDAPGTFRSEVVYRGRTIAAGEFVIE